MTSKDQTQRGKAAAATLRAQILEHRRAGRYQAALELVDQADGQVPDAFIATMRLRLAIATDDHALVLAAAEQGAADLTESGIAWAVAQAHLAAGDTQAAIAALTALYLSLIHI